MCDLPNYWALRAELSSRQEGGGDTLAYLPFSSLRARQDAEAVRSFKQ